MDTYSSSFGHFGIVSGLKLVAVFLLLVLCTVTMAPSAWSQESAATPSSQGTASGTASGAGMGAAAAVSTILYFPFKAAFAIGGGIVGGLAYLFSGGNEQAAKSIWNTSLLGDYYISPDHLEGNRPIRFLGVADSNGATEPASTP
ncbi:MAG TPA: hypothetical protein VLA67_09325 [Nitrospiraceae bacterium]|nr:hypothetical protein [Nitrospiraceae bacterium]